MTMVHHIYSKSYTLYIYILYIHTQHYITVVYATCGFEVTSQGSHSDRSLMPRPWHGVFKDHPPAPFFASRPWKISWRGEHWWLFKKHVHLIGKFGVCFFFEGVLDGMVHFWNFWGKLRRVRCKSWF